ncbi:MAG TPA: hypothetical protein VKP78_06310 [bacterium]|nr:hypothetical protein [bacterium]
MKKCSTLLIFFLPVFLFFVQIISAQERVSNEKRPAWIDQNYPNIYIGISDLHKSEQDARQQAVKDARRQIIESLGGMIESRFVDNIVERQGEENFSSSFTKSRVQVVARNIIAVEPDKIYTEKWKRKTGMFQSEQLYKVYVRVPFSEEKHNKFMDEIINETEQISQNNYSKALQYCQDGQVFHGLDLLKEIKNNVEPMTKITGLKPDQQGRVTRIYQNADNQIKAIKNSINIEQFNQDQIAKFGQPLNKVLRTRVYWMEKGTKYGIPNLNVNYTTLAGKVHLNQRVKTNLQGYADCKVSKVLTAGDIRIKATASFPSESGLDSLESVYNIQSDNRAFVQVIESNFGDNTDVNYLQNAISSRLNQAGFTFIDNANLVMGNTTNLKTISPGEIKNRLGNYEVDFVILGKISSTNSNKVQEGLHFAWSEGVIKLVDLKNMEVIDIYQENGKAAGNSKAKAGQASLTSTGDKLVEKLVQGLGLQG